MADEPGTTIIIKKIKKGGHGHHGGAWKVAYADFVTAMMAFFLLMWILGQSQKTREGIQRYFNDPLKYLFGAQKVFTGMFDASKGQQMISNPETGGVTDGNKPGGLSRLHLLAQKIEAGMTPFKAEVFDFKVSPDRIQFAITAQALFSPGSYLLKPDAESILNRIAVMLKSVDANILVEAHTDDTPADSPNYPTNWELSALRASTVVRYFIEGQYFDPTKMTAMGAGQYRPIADNRTPEGRTKNRRIDIYVVPDNLNRFNIRSTASEGKPITTTPDH